MKSVSARICSNVHLTEDILRMELETQIASEVACGQFVQVQVPGFFLRRPISVSEVTAENRLVLIYRTVGGGTEALAGMREGEVLDVFGPLGNGFPLSGFQFRWTADRMLLFVLRKPARKAEGAHTAAQGH